MLAYEDVEDRQEWGLSFGATNRLVHVLAQERVPFPISIELAESIRSVLSRWTCGTVGWEFGLKGPIAPEPR